MKLEDFQNPETVFYKMVLEHRPKAIKVDMGEGPAVWFPRSVVLLDEKNFTITAEKSFFVKKLTSHPVRN